MKGIHARYDLDDIKRLAIGREVAILEQVAGIPAGYLDGNKEHPCPKCEGKTRFRLIDAKAGAVRCSHCFAKGCGDFIAAVMWMLDIDYPEALQRISEYLGVTPVALKPVEPALSIPKTLTGTWVYTDTGGDGIVGTDIIFRRCHSIATVVQHLDPHLLVGNAITAESAVAVNTT